MGYIPYFLLRFKVFKSSEEAFSTQIPAYWQEVLLGPETCQRYLLFGFF
jgi:hypothetical protein